MDDKIVWSLVFTHFDSMENHHPEYEHSIPLKNVYNEVDATEQAKKVWDKQKFYTGWSGPCVYPRNPKLVRNVNFKKGVI